jgi:hypothetical protein
MSGALHFCGLNLIKRLRKYGSGSNREVCADCTINMFGFDFRQAQECVRITLDFFTQYGFG